MSVSGNKITGISIAKDLQLLFFLIEWCIPVIKPTSKFNFSVGKKEMRILYLTISS